MLPTEVESALKRIHENKPALFIDVSQLSLWIRHPKYEETRHALYRSILANEPAGLAALRTLLGVEGEQGKDGG